MCMLDAAYTFLILMISKCTTLSCIYAIMSYKEYRAQKDASKYCIKATYGRSIANELFDTAPS